MTDMIVKLAAAAALALSPVAARAGADPALVPAFTEANGQTCGRTLAMPEGIECFSSQCYDAKVAHEFTSWAAFEQGFFRDELRRSGLASAPSDFTEICAGYRFFGPEEKELFWLDFLKLMAGYESNFLWLDTYDDLVGGKIVTERGFFQLAKSDCEGLGEVRRDYCATHWPRTNAQCALSIIERLVRSHRGSTIDAIAAHWGSMRSSARNQEGGRREKLKASFMQHPACKYTGPAKAVSAGKAKGKGRALPQAQAQPAPAEDPSRPHFDRLTPKMYLDSDFVRAAILPSYRPAKDAAAACSDAKVTDNPLLEKCKRYLNWKHYQEVDLEYAERHPQ